MTASKFLWLAAISCLVPACGSAPPPPAAAPVATVARAEPVAVALSPAPVASAAPPVAPTPHPIDVTLEPKSGSKLSGKAVLTATADGVEVHLTVFGLPKGEHGAHVHEKGDCSAVDGSSAGGHFNPGSHEHGLPTVEHRHLGDLGNLTIDAKGNGTLDFTVKGANLTPADANSFVGRSIIIHAKKDDGGQPTGNAGGRVGCGVIGS